MVSALKSVGYRFQRSPLRLFLILLTVAIGVGVLGLALTVSFEIASLVQRTLPSQGRVVSLTNGTVGADGQLRRDGPPRLTQDDVAALAAEYPQLRDLTPIAPDVGIGTLQVGPALYTARSLQGVGARYAALMRLTLGEGSFFTQSDETAHSRVAVISEAAARILFGSAREAVGKQFSTVAKMVIVRKGAGDASPRQQGVLSQNAYTVVGVYRDVDEVTRRAYGVGDILVPYSAVFPGDADFPPVIMTLTARVSTDALPVARAKVTEILQRAHGPDYTVALWEGNPRSPDSVIADARDSLTRFSLFLSGLGALVLVVSSFGIFSVMMVEIVDRNREIGLRRAVGATRAGIVGHLAGQAAYLALLGSVIGAILSLAFHGSLLGALAPYLETAGVGPADLRADLAQLPALLIAAASAVVAGAVFTLPPAALAARRPIVECLRED